MIPKNKQFRLKKVQEQIRELRKEESRLRIAITRDIKNQVYKAIKIYKNGTTYSMNMGNSVLETNLPSESEAFKTREIIANAFVQEQLKNYV
jgi:hypothetical protein